MYTILKIEMVQDLLQHGAVVDQIKQGKTDGQTALHWAAQRGDAAILKILLDQQNKNKDKTLD